MKDVGVVMQRQATVDLMIRRIMCFWIIVELRNETLESDALHKKGNNRNLFSHSCGGQKHEIKESAGLCSLQLF